MPAASGAIARLKPLNMSEAQRSRSTMPSLKSEPRPGKMARRVIRVLLVALLLVVLAALALHALSPLFEQTKKLSSPPRPSLHLRPGLRRILECGS